MVITINNIGGISYHAGYSHPRKSHLKEGKYRVELNPKGRYYLCRDAGYVTSYELRCRKPRGTGTQWADARGKLLLSECANRMCSIIFNKVVPKKFHLKPGGITRLSIRKLK